MHRSLSLHDDDDGGGRLHEQPDRDEEIQHGGEGAGSTISRLIFICRASIEYLWSLAAADADSG